MKPPALRRLALAVFFVFGTLGPLLILMQSELKLLSWSFVIIETVATGGMASSIILFARKRWWITILIVAFWTGIMLLNSGGASFQFDDDAGFRVRLQGPQSVQPLKTITQPLTLSPQALDALYTQRGAIGVMAIALLALGYATFIQVIRKEVQQRARLETEVKIARDIQQSLIPCTTFENSWCKVAGMMSSATEVGGDYFDIIPLSDHQLVVAIADVAGHGVGSGILSAMTKSAFRSQLMHETSPAKVLENLNQTIYQVSERHMFVTFAYLLLDERTHTAAYATAGHPPLVFRSNAEQRYLRLRTSNPALGLQQTSQFMEAGVSVSSGDSFLLYTDGIIEAVNTKGEEFGIDRLQDQIAQQQNCTGSDLCSRIVDSVRHYTGSDALKDDVTVVCVKL